MSPFLGWHGDPCTRCIADPDRRHVQRATHGGMCPRCWLGATETQRRIAIWEAQFDPDDLEALYALPAAEPVPCARPSDTGDR